MDEQDGRGPPYSLPRLPRTLPPPLVGGFIADPVVLLGRGETRPFLPYSPNSVEYEFSEVLRRKKKTSTRIPNQIAHHL